MGSTATCVTVGRSCNIIRIHIEQQNAYKLSAEKENALTIIRKNKKGPLMKMLRIDALDM